MLNKILKVIFIIFCVVILGYLSLPNFSFPTPPPGSLKSQEPADLETPLRQGYFTNSTREEVINWYMAQFNHSEFLGIKLPTLLLNYPPEEAQTLIRDQKGSTFLQQMVHPLRESIYINGFKPPSQNDIPVFFVEGGSYSQKIIIRSIPSSIFVRIGFFILTAALMVVVYRAWFRSLNNKNNE